MSAGWWREVRPHGVLVYGPPGLVDLAVPLSAADGILTGELANDITIAEHYRARFALGTRESLDRWRTELRAEVTSG